jgi:hypothetical protein
MATETERQPLLDGPLDRTAYQATESERAASAPTKQSFPISNRDLYWVLAGLWSAVFLGALDGAT